MKINQKYYLLPIAVILDLAFFYILTRLHLEVLSKVAEHMQVINEQLTQKTAELAVSDLGNLNSYLAATPQFMTEYHAVMKLGVVFILGTLISWILLQGLAWWIAHRSAGNKIPLWKYIGRFSIVTILCSMVLSVVLFILTGLVESNAILPLVSENEPFILSAIMVGIIGYFATVLYASPTKAGLVASVKQLNPFAIAYLGALALGGIGIAFGTWIFTLHWGALLVFVLFILLPSLSVYRYYFAKRALSSKIF